MRLSTRIIKILKEACSESFNEHELYLFGSRTDDSRQGGDIDLAIKANIDKNLFRKNKIKFKTFLFRKGYDLKIDLIHISEGINKLLLDEIKSNWIRL